LLGLSGAVVFGKNTTINVVGKKVLLENNTSGH